MQNTTSLFHSCGSELCDPQIDMTVETNFSSNGGAEQHYKDENEEKWGRMGENGL